MSVDRPPPTNKGGTMDKEAPKVTFLLTPKHLRAANLLAAAWSTTRSEAMRRAIELAARSESVWGNPTEEQWLADIAQAQRDYEDNK